MFMFFAMASELEGYGPNENWFYASPLTLSLVWIALAASKKQRTGHTISSALCLLAAAGVMIEVCGLSTQENTDFIGLLGLPLVGVWVALRRTN